jgi:hypothetical protein
MSTNSTSEPRELVETPDLNGAYPRLDEAGTSSISSTGSRACGSCTGWLGGLVDLDGDGFVRVGQDTGRSALETSRAGVFAVGDVRSGSARRVATAVGEGAMAISLAFERTRPG